MNPKAGCCLDLNWDRVILLRVGRWSFSPRQQWSVFTWVRLIVVHSCLAGTIKTSRQQRSVAVRPLQGQRTSSECVCVRVHVRVRVHVCEHERPTLEAVSGPPAQTVACEGQWTGQVVFTRQCWTWSQCHVMYVCVCVFPCLHEHVCIGGSAGYSFVDPSNQPWNPSYQTTYT